MSHVYVGDYGFVISFKSKYDLRGMSNVRMLINKPRGSVASEFATGDFSSVDIDGTILYTIKNTDLDQPGRYEFQIAAKVTGSLDIAFDPFILHVKARSSAIAWP